MELHPHARLNKGMGTLRRIPWWSCFDCVRAWIGLSKCPICQRFIRPPDICSAADNQPSAVPLSCMKNVVQQLKFSPTLKWVVEIPGCKLHRARPASVDYCCRGWGGSLTTVSLPPALQSFDIYIDFWAFWACPRLIKAHCIELNLESLEF